MRNGLASGLMRTVSRFALVGVIGSLAAACSTGSTRLAQSGFSNTFDQGPPDAVMTGSIEPRATAALPVEPIPAASPVRTAAAAPAPVREPARGEPGWSARGGTPITVGSNDTLATLSNRYGVPGSAILSANGLSAGQITSGRHLVIPVYGIGNGSDHDARQVASAKPADAKPAAPRQTAEAAPPKSRARHGQSEDAKAAKAESKAPVRVAQATPKAAAAKPEPASKPVKSSHKTTEPTKAVEPPKVAAAPKPAEPVKTAAAKKAEPVKTAAREAEAPKVVAAAPKAAAASEPESTGALPSAPAAPVGPDFRWPARGRVITGFNGSNEGINIAVPDGTPVKAAGDGVVAYAGSEVKGYGNLVLIRHDNGYVSAYAHNGDLDVKRGQRVARGQTIAKSGQSGNVTSPQLHFEIRKGSTPVDPMRYLASAT